jgi:hypothetical protein
MNGITPNPAGYPDTLPPPAKAGAPPVTVDPYIPYTGPTDEELDIEMMEDMGEGVEDDF